ATGASGSVMRNPKDRERARAWFEHAGPDFLEVCEMAGRCPIQTRAHALDAIAKADANPDRATEGGKTPKLYEHNGEQMTLRQWSERSGVATAVLRYRINTLSMPIAEAMSAPDLRRNRKRTTDRGVGENLEVE